MTIVSPLWLQNEEYPAALDRLIVPHAFGFDPHVLWGMEVTPGPGAQEVTVAPGQAVVGDADEVVGQMVLVTNDAPLVVGQYTQPVAHVMALSFLSSPGFPADEEVGFVNVDVGDDPTPGMATLVEVAAAAPGATITAGMLTDRRVVIPPNRTYVSTDAPPPSLPPHTMWLVVS